MARQHKDKAGTHQSSTASQLKRLHRSQGEGRSLRQYARELTQRDNGNAEHALLAQTWLSNKRLNVSAPLRGIGRTSKPAKGGGGGGKK